jgi:hypothetical protein
MRFGPGSSRLFQSLLGPKGASISADPARGASPCLPDKSFRPSFMYFARAANGRHYPANSAVPVRFTRTFSSGKAADSFSVCGRSD